MRYWREIDFLVKHFARRFSCVALVEICCWNVDMCSLNHCKAMKAERSRLISRKLNSKPRAFNSQYMQCNYQLLTPCMHKLEPAFLQSKLTLSNFFGLIVHLPHKRIKVFMFRLLTTVTCKRKFFSWEIIHAARTNSLLVRSMRRCSALAASNKSESLYWAADMGVRMVFSRGGQLWWNFILSTRNYEKNIFLLQI